MKKETKKNAIIFVVILILTVVFTYPDIIKFNIRLLGIKDSYFYAWNLWWFKHAVFTLHHSPLKLTTLFYPINGIPYIWSSPLNEITGILLLPILPLPVLFNILALMPIIFGTYFTYKLVYYLTGERVAGITSGILFGFSPFIVSTMMGNLQYSSVEFIPLVVFTLIKLKNDPTTRNGLMFILASVLLAMSSPSYIFYAYIPIIVYLPFSWLIKDGGKMWNKNFLLYTLLSMGFIALFALVFYLPQWDIIKHSEYVKASGISQLFLNNQNFLDYFLPNKSNFFFGRILRFVSKDQAYFSDIGIVTIFLITLAIIFKYETKEVIRWGIFAIILYIFSLGIYLKFNGFVTYPYYGSLHMIPLPYLAISKIKLLSHLTQPALLIPLLLLSTSVIAGFGVKLIIKGVGVRLLGFITAISLIFIALVEYYPGYPFPSVQATMPAYYMPIRKDRVTKAIVELPASASVFYRRKDIPFIYRSMYYQIATGKALVGGYYNYQWARAQSFIKTTPFLSELDNPFTLIYGDIIPVNKQPIANYGIRKLMNLGIGYIIVNRLAYNPADYTAITNLLKSYLGQSFYDDGYVSIFVLSKAYLSANPGELMELGSGWYKPGLNTKQKIVFRMMNQNGIIKILGVQKPRKVKLIMGILRPFKSIKRLIITANDKVIGRINLNLTNQLALGWESNPFILKKGNTVITIHSVEKPVNPRKVLSPYMSDSRPVTIGVFGVKLSDTTGK